VTQEEYESKVQSMPQQLRESFRQSLEMSLSSKIVNKFMNVVMSAYAQGQRDAQKDSHDGDYMRGAEDMLEALKIVSSMGYENMQKYFPGDYNNNISGFYMVICRNPGDILEIVDKYRDDQMLEKDERQKTAVQAMADEIGIEKLCEIAEEIRRQKAADGDCLPF
jgi:hypothetical protein